MGSWFDSSFQALAAAGAGMTVVEDASFTRGACASAPRTSVIFIVFYVFQSFSKSCMISKISMVCKDVVVLYRIYDILDFQKKRRNLLEFPRFLRFARIS